MNVTRRLAGALLALVSVLSVMSAGAIAQGYPTKPVRVINPFPPGGPADAIARVITDKLALAWKQPIVIENRAGAGGNVASEFTAKQPPDGYTLLLAASSHVSNGALYRNLAYDPIRDFSAISQVAYYSLILVAHPGTPATTLAELITYAKANPGKLTFGSAGSGTPTHLTAELFRGTAGIDFVHAPYKGAAPATNDLLGGQLSAMFNNPVSALPHVKSGRLRALATTGLKRSPTSPDVPTVAELGYPGFEAGTWYAFLGPAGMPKDMVSKIATDLVAVLQMPDVRERLAGQGVESIGTSPAELETIMRSELEKWTKVIRAANIQPD